ncbi:hypothetical protein EYS14_07210 [Alteromonadaceae bacterium M269]|nr:hypothetical protein EYS14_07210 [Alteromonadaceae bacterium M269]
MSTTISSTANGIPAIQDINDDDIRETENELTSGISNADSELVNLKIEQKISGRDAGGRINIGGFVNSNAKYSRFHTRYMATLLSNKTKQLTDAQGNLVATKRYGIGFGLALDIRNIETKINVNYGVVAASAKMDFADVNYKLNVFGAIGPALVGDMPSVTGDFSAESFDQLTTFIQSAKTTLQDPENTKLYPIEFIKEEDLKIERTDTRSIFFGAQQVSNGIGLLEAIKSARDHSEQFNENVIQFVYRYFGLKDAYVGPLESQKRDALNWLKGSFNKVTPADPTGSWVQIDDVYTGDINSEEINYKPHPVPVDWAELPKTTDFQLQETSADFSSDLKISAIGDGSGEFNTIIIARDLSQFIDVSDNRPAGSQVIETRYGVGLRLKIKLSNIEFGTDVDIGVVGAVSELGLADVEYEISGIGFADMSLLDILPGPMNITQNTMDDLIKVFDDLKNRFAQMDVSDLKPQAFQIRVKEPEFVDPFINAQSIVFAVNQIRNKKKLEETMSAGLSLGLNQDLIKDTYADFGVTDNSRITLAARREAKDWLIFQ